VDHIKNWPIVTLSSFQQRSATARSQSEALYVHINPIVSQQNQAEWQNYVEEDEFGWM
jgi:hypothetical protein